MTINLCVALEIEGSQQISKSLGQFFMMPLVWDCIFFVSSVWMWNGIPCSDCSQTWNGYLVCGHSSLMLCPIQGPCKRTRGVTSAAACRWYQFPPCVEVTSLIIVKGTHRNGNVLLASGPQSWQCIVWQEHWERYQDSLINWKQICSSSPSTPPPKKDRARAGAPRRGQWSGSVVTSLGASFLKLKWALTREKTVSPFVFGYLWFRWQRFVMTGWIWSFSSVLGG